MADILEFRRRGGVKRRRQRDARSGPAKVIIFPGVRIEREEFSLADRVDAQSARRTRNRYMAAEE